MPRLGECLDLMAHHQIDVMLLGREAHARTVAATTRLWLAGTRPFSPSCVVVRATGAVHVLANSDDAVPAGFPTDRLFGITWNPEHIVATLTAIPGVAGAHRVAVDGMSPAMRALVERVFPDAQLVDANALFAQLWSQPSPDQPAGVEAAAEVARAGLAAMVAELHAGAPPRALRGACASAFASFGVTTPAFEAVATPLDADSSTWLAPDRPFADGDLVVLRAGALRDGWEASLARTYLLAARPVEVAPPEQWQPLVDACTIGTAVSALRARNAVVYGVGQGVEPWDDDLVLAPGLLCALEYSDDHCLRQDVLRVTEHEPELVTRSS